MRVHEGLPDVCICDRRQAEVMQRTDFIANLRYQDLPGTEGAPVQISACIWPKEVAAKDYSARAERPGVRRIPVMTSVGRAIYLFGGLDLATGPRGDGPLAAYNDFWRGTPA
jgi:hypothetical protein